MFRAVILALALTLTGCGAESLAWQVDKSSTVEALDQRYQSEVAGLVAADMCVGDDELASLMLCPEYHLIWNRYWWARRSLAELR